MNREAQSKEQTVSVTPQKIYHYNEITKEYVGESDAYLDPLESKKQGKNIYMLPASSTWTEPTLSYKKGYAVVWSGTKWEYIEDHRGETVWDKSTGEEKKVDWLGVVGDGYSITEPPKPDKPLPSIDEIQKTIDEATKQLAELKSQAKGSIGGGDDSGNVINT